jgi:WD40 repeat protein
MSRSFALVVLLTLPTTTAAQNNPAKQPLEGTLIRRLGESDWRSTFELQSPAFSPDGKTLACGGTWNIGLWQGATGKPITTYQVPGCGYFWSVAWGADGSLYAGGQHHALMRWDPKRHKLAQEYAWHKSVIRKISLSADRTLLASLDVDKKVAIWEVPGDRAKSATGPLVRTFELDSPALWPDVALSPDGKYLAASGPARSPVVLLDVGSGKTKAVFNDGANANFLRLAFSPDGKRLVGGEHGVIFVWEVESGKLVHRLKNVDGHHVEGLAISADSKLLAVVGWRDAVHVWNLETGKPHRSLVAPGDRLKGVTFSPDGATIAACGEHRLIHRWQAETGDALSIGSGHAASVEAVAWLSPARIVTSGLDRSLRFWDADTGKLESKHALAEDVRPEGFSADGALLLARSEGHLHLVETTTGKLAARVEADKVPGGLQPALHPDGTSVALPGTMGELHLRPTRGAAGARVFRAPPRVLYALAFSPDGTLLAAGFEQKYKGDRFAIDATKPPPPRISLKEATVLLYDVRTGKQVAQFGEECGSVVRLVFSPDGRHLAVSDGRVHVWDLKRQTKQSGAVEHTNATWLAFAPDGRRLVTVARSAGNGFDVWETATLTRVMRCPGHQVQTVAAAFSPDGRRVVSGGMDTLGLVWDVTGIAPEGRLPRLTWTETELEELWKELGQPQAAPAHAALWRLVASGDQSVKFLKQHLKPTPRVEPKKVKAWIDQLDATQFADRDTAMKALEGVGGAAEDELRAALAKPIPPEMRRRVEQLQAHLGPVPPRLRMRRALCVLEQIGTGAAESFLEELAGGEPRDEFTEEARNSLARLRKKT